MPELTRPDGAVIHYEVVGDGYPLLALAPGGVSSEIGRWADSIVDPMSELCDAFKVIGMDQRFAGASVTPLVTFSYEEMLADQIAVLDAAGAARAHVIGGDFGAAHALRLGYEAPARIASVTLVEPVGLVDSNRIGDYYARFNETIRLARAEGIDAVLEAAIESPRFEDNPAAGPWAQRLHDDSAFREAIRRLGRETYITLVVDFRDGFIPWGRRFFSVSDLAVGRMRMPLLVVPGRDTLHPPGLGQTFLDETKTATVVDPSNGASVSDAIRSFLRDHSP